MNYIKKPIILCFLQHYLPGFKYGGPIRTLSNMVDRMSDEFTFKIITQDRDFKDTEPYPAINRDAWNKVGPAEVFYATPEITSSLTKLRNLINATPHDVLYFNSFFDPIFTVKALVLRRLGLVQPKPVVLAPRGELSPGSFHLKAYKKRPFVTMAKTTGLYKKIIWHASTALDMRNIINVLGKAVWKISEAADLLPKNYDTSTTAFSGCDSDNLKMVYISRVSKEKNLDYALSVLKHVSIPCTYTIYGTLEDLAYWEKCEELIASLPANIKVDYKGQIPYEQVHQSLSQHDLFFFPTRGENFGHVILEAMAAGLPILISDQTPWLDLEEKKVGWALPLDEPAAFAKRIEAAARLTEDEFKAFRQRSWEYALKVKKDDSAVKANRRMFRAALG